MPISINNGNYFEYLDISDVAISIIGYRFVYIIKIPILERENNKAYRVIPAPKPVRYNMVAYISNPHDYIITNDEKLLYTPSDEYFLNTCKIHQLQYFCKRIHPKYFIKSHDACLSKIVNEPLSLKKDDCSIKILTLSHTIWIQFKSNNKWLYMAPKPESIRIICNDRVEKQIINGTKILWLAPGCKGITNDVILNSHFEKTHTNNAALIPFIQFNFSEYFQVFKNPYFNYSSINIQTIETPDLKIGDFTNYGTKLNDITRQVIEIGKNERSKTWYETIINRILIGLYILGGLVILYLINKLELYTIFKCLIVGACNPCYQKLRISNYNHSTNKPQKDNIAPTSIEQNLNSIQMYQRKLKSKKLKRKSIHQSSLQLSEFDTTI